MLVCTAGGQSEHDRRPAGRWWEAWDGRRMKRVRDSVDSMVSFGLKTKYLCSNFW